MSTIFAVPVFCQRNCREHYAVASEHCSAGVATQADFSEAPGRKSEIHQYAHIRMQICGSTIVRTLLRFLPPALLPSLNLSLTHSLTHSLCFSLSPLNQPQTHPHLLTHPLTHPPTHPLTHVCAGHQGRHLDHLQEPVRWTVGGVSECARGVEA